MSDEQGDERPSYEVRLHNALALEDFREAARLAEKVLKCTKKPNIEKYRAIADLWNKFFDQASEPTAADYRYGAIANDRAGYPLAAAQLWGEAIRRVPMSKVEKKHYKKAAVLWQKAIRSEGVKVPAAHYLRAAMVCKNAGYEKKANGYFSKGYMTQAWDRFEQGQYELAVSYGELSLQASPRPSVNNKRAVEKFRFHVKEQNKFAQERPVLGVRRSTRLKGAIFKK